MLQVWSWLLAGIGITGMLLAGSKRKLGWVVSLGAQVVWFAYGASTRQWGFVASSLAYASVYVRNYLRWRREDRVKADVTG